MQQFFAYDTSNAFKLLPVDYRKEDEINYHDQQILMKTSSTTCKCCYVHNKINELALLPVQRHLFCQAIVVQVRKGPDHLPGCCHLW